MHALLTHEWVMSLSYEDRDSELWLDHMKAVTRLECALRLSTRCSPTNEACLHHMRVATRIFEVRGSIQHYTRASIIWESWGSWLYESSLNPKP